MAGIKPIRGSEEALADATGASYAHWLEQLDAAGAVATEGAPWSHTRIAAWLVDAGVDDWWAQHLTVVYEQERGLRAPGQRADGTFSATASRTLDVPVDEAVRHVVPRVAAALGAEQPTLNLAAKNPSGRFRQDDGTVVVIGFSPRGDGRSVVALEHAGLPSGTDLDEVKARLRALLADV